MALTDTAPETASDTHQGTTSETAESTSPVIRTGLDAVLGSSAHRLVGRIFVIGSLVTLVVDLLLAGMVHLDIGGDILFDQALMARVGPNAQLGLVVDVVALMIGLAIIVVPRQVGSATLAFPRAAAAAAWTWVLSVVIWGIAIVAANGSYGGDSETMTSLGNVAFGASLVALVLAAVCVVTTVLAHRAPGQRLADVPFFAFSMLVAGTIWILSFPSAFAHVVIGHITHANPSTLLQLTYGEGLTWLFFQPAIWVVVIPVLGIAADIVAHLAGAQQRFRGVVFGAIGVMGFASFGAWAQSDASHNTIIWIGFALLAVVPPVVVLGAIFDTLRSGSPKVASPVAFAVLSVLLTLGAVLAGLLLALDTVGEGQLFGFDTPTLANAQFVFAIGVAIVGGLGGCVYWARLVFGAPMSEGPAKALGPGAALGVLLFGLPLLVIGVFTPELDVVQIFEIIASIGAALLALVVLGALGGGVATLAKSRRGDDLLADPWGRGATLEWSEAAFPIDPVESPYPLMPATDESGRSLMTVMPAQSVSLVPRRRELLFATAFVTAAVAMLLLTLLGLYLEARTGHRDVWLSDNPIPLAQPNVILFSLLMSSVTVQWAVYSIARDDRGHLYLAIGMTIMFGIAAIVQTWFLFSQIDLAVRQAEGGYFYALTGTHLAMMVSGLLYLAVVGLRALGGSFSARRPEGISASALYWHATVALYAVVWLAVYVMK